MVRDAYVISECYDSDDQSEHETDVESDENEEPHLADCEYEEVVSRHLRKRHVHVISVYQTEHRLHR